MGLRVAVDLDGVLANLGLALTRAVGGGVGLSASGGEVALNTTHLRPMERRVWRRLSAVENFWESLEEIEAGAVRRLAALAQRRGWEVIFLTSRPETAGDTVQVQSQRWLARMGFSLPSVFVTTRSRAEAANALGLHVVMDDNPENCFEVATHSEAQAILVWRGGSTDVMASARRLGIAAVPSFEEGLGDLDDALAAPMSDDVRSEIRRKFALAR